MPLSEDEQRRLDEIERALYQEDPRFAAGQSIDRLRRRRAITSVAALLVGTVLLVVGLVTTSAILWCQRSGNSPGHRPGAAADGEAPGNDQLIVARQVFTGRLPGVGFLINCWSPASAGMTVCSAPPRHCSRGSDRFGNRSDE